MSQGQRKVVKKKKQDHSQALIFQRQLKRLESRRATLPWKTTALQPALKQISIIYLKKRPFNTARNRLMNCTALIFCSTTKKESGTEIPRKKPAQRSVASSASRRGDVTRLIAPSNTLVQDEATNGSLSGNLGRIWQTPNFLILVVFQRLCLRHYWNFLELPMRFGSDSHIPLRTSWYDLIGCFHQINPSWT